MTKINRTTEEKLTESNRRLKKAEKKVTDLSNTAIIRLSRARRDELNIKLLSKRLAEKEALFTDLLRTLTKEGAEAARQFIEIDIESYISAEGTPALDKRIQVAHARIIEIIEVVRDESETYKSFRSTLCNKIIKQIIK